MESPDQTICWWRERPRITKLVLICGKEGDLVASSQLSKVNLKNNHDWFSVGHPKNSSTTIIEPKTGRPLPSLSQLPVTVCAHQGWARVNQQPPMHQLAVLSTGWLRFFIWRQMGFITVHFLLADDHCTFFFGFVLGCFFLGPDLTHSYLTHLSTFINIVPTLIPY